jgi:hypothetical protein
MKPELETDILRLIVEQVVKGGEGSGSEAKGEQQRILARCMLESKVCAF